MTLTVSLRASRLHHNGSWELRGTGIKDTHRKYIVYTCMYTLLDACTIHTLRFTTLYYKTTMRAVDIRLWQWAAEGSWERADLHERRLILWILWHGNKAPCYYD